MWGHIIRTRKKALSHFFNSENGVEQSGPKFLFGMRVTNCPRKKGIYCKGCGISFIKLERTFVGL